MKHCSHSGAAVSQEGEPGAFSSEIRLGSWLVLKSLWYRQGALSHWMPMGILSVLAEEAIRSS